MRTYLRIAISGAAIAAATVPAILAHGDGGGFGRLGGYHSSSSYGGYTGGYTGRYGYAYQQTPEAATQPSTQSPTSPQATNAGPSALYAEAVGAFRDGRYADSVCLARRSAAEQPSDPGVRLLLTLASFALGQYGTAATDAHVAASLGQLPDWAAVYAIYGNVDTYTRQLRALEQFVAKTPSAAEGRFLLGFQYAMLGHKGPAQKQLLAALKATPQDRVAAELLAGQGGAVPPHIAALQAQAKPAVVKN